MIFDSRKADFDGWSRSRSRRVMVGYGLFDLLTEEMEKIRKKRVPFRHETSAHRATKQPKNLIKYKQQAIGIELPNLTLSKTSIS